MARGGYRPGAGRKPNPNKGRTVAAPKLAATRAVATVPAEPKLGPAIDPAAWAMMLPEIEEISRRYATNKSRDASMNPFKLPSFPPGSVPPPASGLPRLAMDAGLEFGAAQWNTNDAIGGLSAEGLLFLGYPYLAELAQRSEYRIISETIADDATRKWIDFDVTGDDKAKKEAEKKDPEGFAERMADPDEKKKRVAAAGKTDKVKALKDDQIRLGVRDRMYELLRGDGFFGRMHLYLEMNGLTDFANEELKMPIGDGRSMLSKGKIEKGSFTGLRAIEPVWSYPLVYNTNNPLKPDWYNPTKWYVMGQEVDASRLLTMIGRPVPDMLKPAYGFGGLSLSQMAKPYVDIWLETRTAVGALIHSFSVMVLMTDLSTLMQPNNAAPLIARIALFNMLRDNQGTFVVNKNTEDFKNVSASLGGLHELQAQAQEHVAAVGRIPIVKFTGIQPAGLNADSEGVIKVYDDTIAAYQNRTVRPPLTTIVNFEQLALWGEIDPEITFHFETLREATEAEKGEMQKKDAERHQTYVDMGAFAPAEVRKIAIDDPQLPYAGLNPDDVPDLAEEEEEGLEPKGGKPDPKAEGEPDDGGEGGGANDAALPFGATDAEGDWREEDHPRAPDGKFGSGGGSSKTTQKALKGEMPDIPDFLKKAKGDKPGGGGQTLKMPQFGLTPTPWESHQFKEGFKLPPRGPMPKNEGEPGAAASTVVFTPKGDHGLKTLNGVAFKKWSPPEDWANVEGQAEIDEPPLPEIPEGMTLSSGAVIREPDGRVWLMRPSKGFGGYDQTFPKGGVEEGLSPQANAIKEVFEETGLQIRITGFAGDHDGDTTVNRYYLAERVGGDPAAGWEAEAVVLAPPDKLDGLLNRKRDKGIAASIATVQEKPKLNPKDLKQVGKKMGSNEGGTFEDKDGNRFYIKRPESKAHVQNEIAAARLYQLAGVNTLNYREVEGGNHVATDLEKLDKKNIADFTPEERKEATKDFAIHAWLSNYDAAGTGGDNQGVHKGKVTTLDVGGSLRYRAQGAPKTWWGPKVGEIDSMRDPKIGYDAAKLFGKMSESELKASAARVTSIPDAAIRKAVGDDKDLADTLIERKKDLAKRFSLQAMDEAQFEESKHPRAPDGKFSSTGGGSTTTFKTKKEHAEHLLLNGTTTKQLLAALGWPSVSMPQQAAALGLKLEKTKNANGETFYKGTPMTEEEKAAAKAAAKKPVMPQPKEKPPQNFEEFKQHLADYKKSGDTESAVNLMKFNEAWSKQFAEEGIAKNAPPKPPEKPIEPAKPKHGPASAAELAKAKKTGVPLQMQYVPNASGLQSNPAAIKLVDDFNTKWLPQTQLTPAQLQEKVDDFKDLGEAMIPLMSKEKQEAAAKQKQLVEEAKVAAAKAQAAQAAEKLKAKEQHAHVAKELGLTDEGELQAFDAFIDHFGGADSALKQFKSWQTEAQNAAKSNPGMGFEKLSGFEMGCIKAYTGPKSGWINQAIINDVATPAQHMFEKVLNSALDKLPKRSGVTTKRGLTLSPEVLGKLKAGNVWTHRNFASTSSVGWGGNTKLHIETTGKGGAYVDPISSHKGEDETLFKSNLKLLISKVEKVGGHTHVYCREM